MVIEFTIPGEPKGKGRPRLGRSGHAYTPHDTAAYENLVKVCFSEAYPDHEPLSSDIPVTAYIRAYYKIPKSTSKKKYLAMIIGSLYPLKKPDLDNIAKIICDALNGIAYYDDAQVRKMIIEKYYSKDPRVDVRFEWENDECISSS